MARITGYVHIDHTNTYANHFSPASKAMPESIMNGNHGMNRIDQKMRAAFTSIRRGIKDGGSVVFPSREIT